MFGTDWPYADLPREGDPAPGLDGLGPDLRARIDAANAAGVTMYFTGTRHFAH